jgi:hypothetical protein
LFNWSARKPEHETAAEPPSSSRIVETLSTSRALPKFLAALTSQPAPLLLDLGPVVGGNVSFFGDRLACKIVIEDLYEDIEACARRGNTEGLAEMMTARVTSSIDDSVSGVLCWDLFDYLDRPTASALARCLSGVLRPKGVLHGLFGTTAADLRHRTKFIVQSETTVKCRCEPAPLMHRHALQTGEIGKLFQGLTIVESVLLQNKTRESLFRKS